ncbi:uncharacterized protein LOC133452753 [Cololabis saira]|uniref:uncharacterized protein LOC133452753 n=1 Tax=Cololabis saira TaxID=129043 RepID=UPI002AD45E5F|nr:uncharacterized protein LOC133452753 [Cololabis saira]XP_061588355.1 uncharacterized protein LOC133452753 [Cololabis saira]
MESPGVSPPRMDWESSNLPDTWRKFRQHVELMFSGPLQAKKEEEKCSYFLLWVGEKGRDVFNTWTLTAEQRKLLRTYYDRFEAHVTPKANPILARYKFHEKTQGQNESFDQFVSELRLLVKDCNYPNSEEMIRDRVVFAIHSPRVREQLLCHGPDLTLEKAVEIARSHELSQLQLEPNMADQSVHAESRTMKPEQTSKPTPGTEGDSTLGCREGAAGRGLCRTHDWPAKGRQCNKCKKSNHFAKEQHLRKMYPGQSFDSFDHFSKVLKGWSEEGYHPVHKERSEKIQDETLLSTIKYSRLTLSCVHYGARRTYQSNHERPFQHSLRMGCPVIIKIRYDRTVNKLVVSKVVEEHNHPVSAQLFQKYAQNRRPNAQERQEIEKLLELKVSAATLKGFVNDRFGKQMTLKDLHNIRQQVKKAKQNNLTDADQIVHVPAQSHQADIVPESLEKFHDTA